MKDTFFFTSSFEDWKKLPETGPGGSREERNRKDKGVLRVILHGH